MKIFFAVSVVVQTLRTCCKDHARRSSSCLEQVQFDGESERERERARGVVIMCVSCDLYSLLSVATTEFEGKFPQSRRMLETLAKEGSSYTYTSILYLYLLWARY